MPIGGAKRAAPFWGSLGQLLFHFPPWAELKHDLFGKIKIKTRQVPHVTLTMRRQPEKSSSPHPASLCLSCCRSSDTAPETG